MGFWKRVRKSFEQKLEALKNRECDRSCFGLHQKLLKKLYTSRLVENALNVGDKVPMKVLQDCFGEKVDVNELLQKGPLVIKFIRGLWCDYCATDVQFMHEQMGVLQGLNASAVVISTQTAESMAAAAKEKGYAFPMVSDRTLDISKKFGLLFTLTEEIIANYKTSYGVDVEKYHSKGAELSLPATYVVDRSGTIIYAHLDEDFRKRAMIDEVVRFVKKANRDRRVYATKCVEQDCPIKNFIKGAFKQLHDKREAKRDRPNSSSGELHSAAAAAASSAEEAGPTPGLTRSNSLTPSEFAKDPLRYCLQNEDFLISFQDYLSKTFCTENLLFFLRSTNFENDFAALSEEQRRAQAKGLFESFIALGSDLEVNIDDGTRERISERYAKGDVSGDLFAEASREVYHLMQSDSFSKWKRTKEFRHIWKKQGSLEFLNPAPTFVAEAA